MIVFLPISINRHLIMIVFLPISINRHLIMIVFLDKSVFIYFELHWYSDVVIWGSSASVLTIYVFVESKW